MQVICCAVDVADNEASPLTSCNDIGALSDMINLPKQEDKSPAEVTTPSDSADDMPFTKHYGSRDRLLSRFDAQLRQEHEGMSQVTVSEAHLVFILVNSLTDFYSSLWLAAATPSSQRPEQIEVRGP